MASCIQPLSSAHLTIGTDIALSKSRDYLSQAIPCRAKKGDVRARSLSNSDFTSIVERYVHDSKGGVYHLILGRQQHYG